MNLEQLLKAFSQVLFVVFQEVENVEDILNDKQKMALIASIIAALDELQAATEQTLPEELTASYAAGLSEAQTALQELLTSAPPSPIAAAIRAAVKLKPVIANRIHLNALNNIISATLSDLKAAFRLAPNTKATAMKWYQYCIDNKTDVLIYETIRTVAQQRENIKKGASKMMKSYHIVGQALDFVPIVDDKAHWPRSVYASIPFISAIIYAEKLGFESGLRWGWDAPHLEFKYNGYGTDKILTTAAAAPINTLSTNEITALQEKLTKLGLDTNGIDGIYGKGTTNAVMILQRRTGLVIDGVAGKATLAKIDQLLEKKSLVGTPGIFRVRTGTFGTPEAAEKAAKELGFNARKGADDNRVYTGVFTSLESAEEARAIIEAEHGYKPRIKSYSESR